MAIIFTKEKKRYQYLFYGAILLIVVVGLSLTKTFLIDPILEIQITGSEFPIQINEGQLEAIFDHPLVSEMEQFPSIEAFPSDSAGRTNPFIPLE